MTTDNYPSWDAKAFDEPEFQSRNSKGYSVRYILPSLRIITLTVGTIIHSKKYLINPKRTVESQRLHRPQTYKGRFSLSYPINLDNSQMNGVVTTFQK